MLGAHLPCAKGARLRTFRPFWISTLVLGLVAWGSLASAQTDVVETNAGVQFDFINPGARSLALGGAFLGLADDATAALTNPAGLTFLSKRELSIEGRARQFVTPYVSGGRISGTPTGTGLDLTPDLQTSDSRQSANSVSFLSFVYPTARWAIAAYRQQVANFRASEEGQGVFITSARFPPYQGAMSLDIVRYGIAGAAKLGDKASVGVGVNVYDFGITAETRRYNTSTPFGPSDFSSLFNRQTETGAGTKLGVNIGLTATPTARLQIGAVYRQGANFSVDVGQSGNNSPVIGRVTAGTFSIPDVYGFGVALHPADRVRVMIDYDRVQYSVMTKGFLTLNSNPAGFPIALPTDFKIDDANEVHAGAEYVFLNLARPIAIRGGAWYDPDHALRFEPDTPSPGPRFDSIFFRKGKDVVHVTGGAGVSLRGLEINLAGDYSARGSIFSISSVARF